MDLKPSEKRVLQLAAGASLQTVYPFCATHEQATAASITDLANTIWPIMEKYCPDLLKQAMQMQRDSPPF